MASVLAAPEYSEYYRVQNPKQLHFNPYSDNGGYVLLVNLITNH